MDGWKNGVSYNLVSGSASLTSTAYITSNPSGTQSLGYTVALKKHETLWADKNMGTINQTATVNGYNNSANWSLSANGTYYFYFYKNDEVNTLEVIGTLTN